MVAEDEDETNTLSVTSKDYQLLCANCNWIKRYENKEYMKPQSL